MLGFGESRSRKHNQDQRRGEEGGGGWISVSFKPENFIPGLVIGFIFGLLLDLTKLPKSRTRRIVMPTISSKKHQNQDSLSSGSDQELKLVLVVRQDLRTGAGKIASQCARQRSLLRQWESCDQPKIVVTCKNQQEMNKLKNTAESIGIPTFVVADAGRTQVLAGSKTVLAIGPGPKASVDSVTGKLRLL